MGKFNQFWLLLWKNFILQKRRPVGTVFELILPVVFAIILLLIRTAVEPIVHSTATTWDPFHVNNLPSFKPDVLPKDKTWLIAYAPDTEEALQNVMSKAESFLNDIPKTPLERACPGLSILSSPELIINEDGGMPSMDQLPPGVIQILEAKAEADGKPLPLYINSIEQNDSMDALMESVMEEYAEQTMKCVVANSPPQMSQQLAQMENNQSNSSADMMKMISSFGVVPKAKILGFPTEDSFLEYAKNDTNLAKILCAVIFDSYETGTAPKFQYRIRPHADPVNVDPSQDSRFTGQPDTWKTNDMFPLYQMPGPRSKNSQYGGQPGYYKEGFLSVMHAVDMGILSKLSNQSRQNLAKKSFTLERFPYPPYIEDPFLNAIKSVLPLLLLLSFFYTSLTIVKSVVHEKETKMKEYLMMTGLPNWLHWLAWFIKYLVFMSISCVLITILYKVSTKHGTVLTYSEGTLIFVFLVAYSASVITFCFMVSVFFSKANIGAAAGGVLFGLSYMPYLFIQNRYSQMSMGLKTFSCLLSNVAMGIGAQLLSMFEGKGTGVQWSNLAQDVSVDDNFTFLQVIVMLLVDCVLYCMIAWYVEGVWPGEYGIPKPWYFPFLRSYWLGPRIHTGKYEVVPVVEVHENGIQRSVNSINSQRDEEDSEYFEDESPSLTKIVKINKLHKIFNPGPKEKVAVNGLSLNMYEGQITVLLGHNGAGKTTTMSILTGLFPPTSGSATVMGHNIATNMDLARKSMGLCPQHNILFDQLTVDEHLYFFSRLKGLCKKEAEEECKSMCETLQLSNKREALSSTLSGGMKRKLSVGLALCAGSKFIVLDEPTAGMDPEARRAIWDVLQLYRSKCSMLLSTHFMDEADLLGDRISIMADGKLRCAGSSVFLKNKFGVGYHVILTKTPSCSVSKVTDFFHSFVPACRMERTSAAEISFLLPFEASHLFKTLFTELDKSKDMLGILSYGASITTLEEVFLCVTENAEMSVKVSSRRLSFKMNEEDSGLQSSNPSLSNEESLQNPTSRNIGVTLWMQQLKALIIKRMIHSKRNVKVMISQLLVPVIFVVIAILNAKYLPFLEDNRTLDLSLAGYGKTRVVYSANSLSEAFAERYVDQLSGIANTLNVSGDLEKFLVKESAAEGGSFAYGNVIAATLRNNRSDPTIAWFNAQAYHSPANTILYADQAYMRWKVNNSEFSLGVSNDPLPRNSSNRIQEQLLGSMSGFMIAFNVVLGFSFLAASFAIFIVRERTDRAALLQKLAGVDPFCFWLSAFIWDFVNFILPCFACIILFVAFGIDEYISGGHVWITLLLFALYCWSALPLTYIMSYLFQIPVTALVTITIFGVLAGLISIITVGVLMIINDDTRNVADILDWVFLILPQYCIGQGLADFYTNNKMVNICTTSELFEIICREQGIDFQTNYLAWERYGVGRFAAFMSIEGILFFAILFAIEYDVHGLLMRIYLRFRSNTSSILSEANRNLALLNQNVVSDYDVVSEENRINETVFEQLVDTDLIFLKNLRKVYSGRTGNEPLVAVNNLSVGIARGECFGLLGINGAGKTTTFKILTGDIRPTSGTAYLTGCDIASSRKQAQQKMGYCPQFDALIEQMTGRELLTMFARLRGIKEERIAKTVQRLGTDLNFSEHINKLCGTYSGGNKRKLSTALALLGGPPVILLDEPSTGMDPGARRKLWDTISKKCTNQRCVIITSHSMEECEALCTRLAIMVNGQLRCLGSPQHLKNKFGQGYSVEVKMANNKDDPAPVKDYMQKNFPGTIIKDEHQGLIAFQVPNMKPNGEAQSLANIFGCMEDAKRELNLRDYSVSQTTLEQVFLSFARNQRAIDDM